MNRPFLFVILHGSWQSNSGWQAVSTQLKLKNYSVLLVNLPGHGDNPYDFKTIHLQTYVEYVYERVQPLQENYEIVLVGHSMSGMVISQLAENLKIKLLIYVAAFLPIDQECLIDIAMRSEIDGVSKNRVVDKARQSISLISTGLEKIFYNDCDIRTIKTALSGLQAEPLLPFHDRVSLTQNKFGSTAKAYIECTEDNAISIKLQREMYSRWQCSVYSLDAGHAPFYSMPDKLSETLIKALQTAHIRKPKLPSNHF